MGGVFVVIVNALTPFAAGHVGPVIFIETGSVFEFCLANNQEKLFLMVGDSYVDNVQDQT